MQFVRRSVPYVVLALLVAAGAGLWFKQDEVLDWAASRGYEPTAQIAQLAADTKMTPYAERLFYANRPALEGKQEFNKHCTDPSEQVAVLGCFRGNRMGIYLYDVTDGRLQGIEQVTAAHEMLHQAYQRLNKSDKTRISGLLQEYHDLKASQKLKDKIASYKNTEPTQLQNEMHSIFGTEARDLPSELEEYYRQYFTDRKPILAFYERYQSEFDQRLEKIASLDAELARLKTQIEGNKAKLEGQELVLRQRRAQLDAYLAANEVEAYNEAVPPFNALVNSYRGLVQATNGLVDQFNTVLAERNDLAVQEKELEAAIDSSVDTADSQ